MTSAEKLQHCIDLAPVRDRREIPVLAQIITYAGVCAGYTQKETDVILSVVSNYELPKIQQVAREIDPACFMIISNVTEVWGRGFSYSKHD